MASVSHAWLSLLSSLISVKAISSSNKGKIKLSLLLCQIVVSSVMKVDFFFFPFTNLPNRLGNKEVVQISSEEKLEEPKSPEKGNEYSCNTRPTELRAKEIILPNVIGMFINLVIKMVERKAWKKDHELTL